jgi:hypothetical protein
MEFNSAFKVLIINDLLIILINKVCAERKLCPIDDRDSSSALRLLLVQKFKPIMTMDYNSYLVT